MEGVPRATPLLMAFILWFCSLPIVFLLVVPLLGRAAAGPAAVIMLFALLSAFLALCRAGKGPGKSCGM